MVVHLTTRFLCFWFAHWSSGFHDFLYTFVNLERFPDVSWTIKLVITSNDLFLKLSMVVPDIRVYSYTIYSIYCIYYSCTALLIFYVDVNIMLKFISKTSSHLNPQNLKKLKISISVGNSVTFDLNTVANNFDCWLLLLNSWYCQIIYS